LNDGDKKPAVVSMEDVFDNDLTQGSIPDNLNVPQSVSEVAQSTPVNTGNVVQSTSTFTQSTTVNTDNVAQSTSTFTQSNTQLAAALANNDFEWDGLYVSPRIIQTLCLVLYFIFYASNNSPSYFLFVQMIADDTTARVILEEDRQAEAILKEFSKGTCVLRADQSADLFAIQNMMSPGQRIKKSSAIKDGKQLVVATAPKKKILLRHAMPMFNDPVTLPVHPEYLKRTSTNLPEDLLPGMVTINR
jgi:hypothetical protein